MDKISWAGVITCLILLFAWQYHVDSQRPVRPRTAPVPATAQRAPVTPAPSVPSPEKSVTTLKSSGRPATLDLGAEQTAVLENDFVRATFTSHGGAIREIILKKHRGDGTDPVTLNNTSSGEGVLNLTGWEGTAERVPYRLESASDREVVFSRQLTNGITVRRAYQVSNDYVIHLAQSALNTSPQAVLLPPYRLNVGTAGPIHFHDQPTHIKAMWYPGAPASLHPTLLHDFDAGGFLGFGYRAPRTLIESEPGRYPLVAVGSQFFTLILTTPENFPAVRAESRRVPLPNLGFKTAVVPQGIEAAAWFPETNLQPGASDTREFKVYAGPKEYSRLKVLGSHEDLVMEFGFWSWVVKPLLITMKWIQGFIFTYGIKAGSWGVAIIILTLIIKAAFWPLQSAANRSMKQMQAVAPKIKALQEKYKDDSAKLNTEMMKVYKEYGINPVGGCLPLLVQLPIFIGFYTMLQSSVELRNASFLWIHDLSQPDTIAQIPGLGYDLNPLPLIMTVTSMLLMRMTPQTSDNPQMKMMQWMPLMFLVFLYNFAAALSLYWTVNNLVSMLQTWRNLKQPLPDLKKISKKKLPQSTR